MMNAINKKSSSIKPMKPRGKACDRRIRELEMDLYTLHARNVALENKLNRVEWVIPLVNEIELALRKLRGG